MPRTLQGPYLITETPGLTKCPKCRQPVMAACVGGLDRRVGTECVNEVGELFAALAGRATFELRGELLIHRTPIKIRAGFPADAPVMAEHACNTPVPEEHIEDRWSAQAVELVVKAIGGVIVGTGRTNDQPPF